MTVKLQLYRGDCRDILLQIDGVTAIVTDPPYGLKFMGKGWDHGVPGPEFWELLLASAVPGAPLLAFGGTRTFHRLACAIEDAGWQIRDCLMWVYGSGFPKSHNISRAVDKAAGELWDGYGTALKPAWEPILLAMKPLDGTYAANAQEHGVVGLNIAGGRIGNTGRWPANILFDVETAVQLDAQSGISKSGKPVDKRGTGGIWSDVSNLPCGPQHGDKGGASRFFYCAKASTKERGKDNQHPTVKPLALMRYLLTLVTMPERNLILDPFMGSGSTGVAAQELELPFVGIEQDRESFETAQRRMA